ncbi:twin-arginine translocation pathway signal [Thiobacillus denitrificans ATCC 25259]|uniref:Twin-arginine translocation pathway signal n=1 Tax=Thiobacillus denitrificans (strain ATCC 25259 / T1) TaxID=292415 RepID=Q3SJK2_THIDA|nr:intradiol ring-cleavage dioxygenase [Thiobacillus denitrificans]AAZ97155.1 twin-arginine translocation pathway signal [Thiobacillus denitrificans ATCC 25259]
MTRPPQDRTPCCQTRRALLGLIGTGLSSLATGVGTAAQAPRTPGCIVRPEQMEGPYFVEARLRRSDIRAERVGGAPKPGVPLHLTFRVLRFDGRRCTAVPGAVVDVWQCDARGVYSGVRDFAGRFDTRGEQFLRGYQMTDAEGLARFVTIYPGWYPGRAVHLHFKIRTEPGAARGEAFTSQLYFDDALTDRIHSRPPYRREGVRRTRNADDGIFQAGGEKLILNLTRSGESASQAGEAYAAIFDIALSGSGA